LDQYNPLDKRNLGRSVAEALLERNLVTLPSSESRDRFVGAGVYAIYYFGVNSPFPPYKQLADHNNQNEDLIPIYVGKAIPEGARMAGVGLDAPAGTALFNRLRQHGNSIRAAANLDLNDFKCRFLLVDDIWIPLGESLLIQRFRPIWNVLVDGFGNHDPGSGRSNQQRSAWDTIHSGRDWAERLPNPNQATSEEIMRQIERFLLGETVPTIPILEAMTDEGEC